MMHEARKGLAFPLNAIMKVYDKLDRLSQIQDRFTALIEFLQILNILSLSEGAYTLATTSYAKVKVEDDSRRILKVKNYISEHYMEEIKLSTIANIANMSDSAFSRFFKLHTGKTLSDYIIDIRMGYATRKLIDTNESVSEISFACGYNNLSNFMQQNYFNYNNDKTEEKTNNSNYQTQSPNSSNLSKNNGMIGNFNININNYNSFNMNFNNIKKDNNDELENNNLMPNQIDQLDDNTNALLEQMPNPSEIFNKKNE